jgi:hypothetical protein
LRKVGALAQARFAFCPKQIMIGGDIARILAMFPEKNNLDEAAQIAKGNPCLDNGLFVEVRPVDPQVPTPDNTR